MLRIGRKKQREAPKGPKFDNLDEYQHALIPEGKRRPTGKENSDCPAGGFHSILRGISSLAKGKRHDFSITNYILGRVDISCYATKPVSAI